MVREKHGDKHLKNQKARTELARVNRELKRLKTETMALEDQKAALIVEIAK